MNWAFDIVWSIWWRWFCWVAKKVSCGHSHSHHWVLSARLVSGLIVIVAESVVYSILSIFVSLGFGSTTHQVILHNAVHYDCGCIISVNGDLVQFPSRPTPSALNVPAVYIVYFATFGAMVRWSISSTSTFAHVPLGLASTLVRTIRGQSARTDLSQTCGSR